MDKATYRKELTAKTIQAVADTLNELSDDNFFELLQGGGELVIKSGKAPNGQSCDLVAVWSAGSADFNYVDKCTFEARGEAGVQKLPPSKVDQILGMIS